MAATNTGKHDAGYRKALRDLAALHRVKTAYIAGDGRRRLARDGSLVSVLASMGIPSSTPREAREALNEGRARIAGRLIEPVCTAWTDADGLEGVTRTASVALRWPEDRAPSGTLRAALEFESGEVREWSIDSAELTGRKRRHPRAGIALREARFALPDGVPVGYHRLRLTLERRTHEAMLIVAPLLSFAPDHWTRRPGIDGWGVFCPTYALRSNNDPGCGNFSELRRLAQWSASMGASAIATLPLTAVYLDEPFLPGPYSPVSRLFWNELFVDPMALPEAPHSEELTRVLRSASYQRELDSLRQAELVQYRRQAMMNRDLLRAVGSAFYEHDGESSDAFREFLAESPEAERYARFRAVTERRRTAWNDWPKKLREGKIREDDYDAESYRYHLFAQFSASRQMHALARDLRAHDMRLYLDLPVGVHRYGYDTWSRQHLWVDGASVGAPPDPYFTLGQDWGFPPMHPEACREEGHEYFIAALRNQLRYAGYMRLDHVMAFDRLFWIPDGLPASEGVYVGYEGEEFYAILSIESHRERCVLVGENIGTVPPEVIERMDRCGIGKLYIGQFAGQAEGDRGVSPVDAGTVASLNTHDMPPFALYWSGADVDERIALGIFQEKLKPKEHAHLEAIKPMVLGFLIERGLVPKGTPIDDAEAIRDGLLKYLAGSEAQLVLVNLEDLWLERRWQNIPSTHDEYPNWRHKIRRGLEDLEQDPEIAALLRRISSLRDEAAQREGPVPASA
ncbi:MAG: 4-alpha-glucanotransferase [Phycisphaerales bacterium]